MGITGTAQVGQTLTANIDALGGSGAVSYQWQRGDSADGGFTDISENAGEARYTLTNADLGKYLRVRARRAENRER